MSSAIETVRVLTLDESCPVLPLVEGEGRAVAVIWPGSGSTHRSMHHFTLGPAAYTVTQQHPGEAAYYVKAGSGTVINPSDGTDQPLVEGSMVHVGPGTAYRFLAGEAGMEILGGGCPPDPALYTHL